MLATFVSVLLVIVSTFLILLVLVQKGRGGGLAGAFGGMGGQSAFGTKAGDMFTKITSFAAVFWIFLCLASFLLLASSQSPLATDMGANARKGENVSPGPKDTTDKLGMPSKSGTEKSGTSKSDSTDKDAKSTGAASGAASGGASAAPSKDGSTAAPAENSTAPAASVPPASPDQPSSGNAEAESAPPEKAPSDGK